MSAPDLIQQARDLHAGDDLQIDDDATISEAEGGAWVAAWVWVEYPEEGAPE